jgi:hypothetical protein
MLVISLIVAVFVCAVSHALDTRTQRRDLRNNAPLPSEAARTILTAKGQVKIAPKLTTALNWLILFRKIETGCAQLTRCKSDSGNRRLLPPRYTVGIAGKLPAPGRSVMRSSTVGGV